MDEITTSKVSVVIPVKNGERYIADALRSVCSQDYKNLEVIVGVNSLTDSTITLLNQLDLPEFIQIHVFSEGVGMPANFNRTTQFASGKYLKFLCHDDVLRADAISRMVEVLDNNEDVAAVTSYESFIPPIRSNRSVESFGNKNSVGKLRSIYRFSKFGNWIGGPSGLMVRRSLFHDSFFNENLECAFDLEYWIRITRRGKFWIVPETLYSTRLHSEQGTHRCRDGGFEKDLNQIFRTLSNSGSCLSPIERLIVRSFWKAHS